MAIDLNELAVALGKIILRFRVRRRLAADWVSLNEVLLDAEIGLESDTDLFKFGDGTTPWNSLDYAGGGQSLGPDNAGAAIVIESAAPFNNLPATSTIAQAAATATAGNRQVVWMKWGGYPTSDSDWAPPNGTTFTIFASKRGSDDAGTGSLLAYGQLTFSAGISYGPDDTTRYNIVGGVGSGDHSSLIYDAATVLGVDMGGYHRSDDNLPSDACVTSWSDPSVPVWANWAITLPKGEPGVVQPNPGNGQPVPDYSEWAIYATSLPGDSSAPSGSARLYYSPTTEFVALNAGGFIKAIPTSLPQISHVDFGRSTVGEGLILTVVVDSSTYSYQFVTGNTLADGLTALAAVVNADGSAEVVASVSSGVLVLTGKTDGTAVTISGSSKGRPLLIINDGIRSLTAGANVSIDDSDPHNLVISAAGGGGGGGGGATSPDDPPAIPNAMDDEFEGTSLDMTKWTWQQQNTASEIVTQGNLVFTGQLTSSNVINALEQNLPSGTSAFIVKAGGLIISSNNYAGSIHLRESATNKVMGMGIFNNGGSILAIITNGTMSGGYVSLIWSAATSSVGAATFPGYYKVEITSTQIIFSVSADGIVYVAVGTFAFTTYFTTKPDRIGMSIRSGAATTAILSAQYFRRIA